ncbi:ABC transporter ATP-binding protein [Thermoflexibacter ruber]|uniref:ATP-binding cassette, subfamily B, MsbA n=1 Tax=Thermoflexibacter ruber TaxID=1003 RepID=A0A1I2EKE2_9BACT|nr:ABC transporter ATP-binding protein [Thermoflexibacter ruber]SFE93482.1 ATP-binding cassette, subfamily B, MsbA [Thermoflexibacter ruber]
MNSYLRIISYSKPYSSYVPTYLILTLLAVIFGSLNFVLLTPVLDVLFQSIPAENLQKPEFAWSINYPKQFFYYYLSNIVKQYGSMKALQLVCAVIVVSVLLSNVFRYASFVVINKAMYKILSKIREEIFNKMLSLDLAYLSNEAKGDLLSRITNDVEQVEHGAVMQLKGIIKEPLTILVNFSILLYISFKLTIFVILVLPVAILLIARLAKSLRKHGIDSQQLLGKILSTVEETLSGLKIIKAFNASDFIRQKFHQQNQSFTKTIIYILNKGDLASPISETVGVVTVCIILLYGGSLVLSDSPDLTASQFFAYIAIFLQILNPAKAFSSAVSALQRGLAAADRIWAVLDIRPKIKNAENPISIKAFKESIIFKNVFFSYNSERTILKNINLEIKKGKMVALVGNSGGGKSTLADLIPRFYDVSEGEILLDGTNIQQYDLEELRKLMGIVTQESILFNDTIFNNIAFGVPNATEEAVIQAAKIANAHDFIIETENGYQTNIGDRGMKLSGGQRQRLSIARAVLKNPPILILDEATSALDSQSERLVQDALNHLMENRTSIVIAHRLSTIQQADEIIVLQEGEIIERGTHEDLLANEGFYKRLIALQWQ